MTLAAFKATLTASTPPAGLSAPLVALWHDGRGDWDTAHQVAQDIDDRTGAWIHAYLHRKEGDASNAAYWYRRASRPVASVPLEAEWDAIAAALLAGED
jgi:phage major head subunit gpT-like protein